MTNLTVCPNRKGSPRVSMEVCEYHVQTNDPVYLKRLGGKGTALKCETARKLKEEEDES